jgi:hypothetical protein
MAKKPVKSRVAAARRRDADHSVDAEPSKNGDKSAFFLRGLSASVASDIAKLAGDRGTSSNRLIVHIIETVFARTELLALALQDGSSVGSLQRFGDAFETVIWANRAFEKHLHSSAIAAYSKLVAEAPERQMQGMAQLARYLGGSTLIEISNQLEFRALHERRMPTFRDAERAITLALALYEEYLSIEPSNVIVYNSACAYALLARVGIHAQLAASSKEIFAGFKDLKFADAEDAYRAVWTGAERAGDEAARAIAKRIKIPSEGIADSWRASLHPEQVERAERLTTKAFQSLEELLDTRSTRNIIGPNITDQGYWVEYAAEDPHLLILRADPAFSAQFVHWQETFYGRKEAIAPPLHALIEAETALPRRIASRASEIASDLIDRGRL